MIISLRSLPANLAKPVSSRLLQRMDQSENNAPSYHIDLCPSKFTGSFLRAYLEAYINCSWNKPFE